MSMMNYETMEAGIELDELVASAIRSPVPQNWHPSTDIGNAMGAVAVVQTLHPGWRFSLLGGDRQMGYRTKRNGDVVLETKSRCPFGWRVEFFGEVDPRKNFGQRHGSAHAETAALAISRAIVIATKSVKKQKGMGNEIRK